MHVSTGLLRHPQRQRLLKVFLRAAERWQQECRDHTAQKVWSNSFQVFAATGPQDHTARNPVHTVIRQSGTADPGQTSRAVDQVLQKARNKVMHAMYGNTVLSLCTLIPHPKEGYATYSRLELLKLKPQCLAPPAATTQLPQLIDRRITPPNSQHIEKKPNKFSRTGRRARIQDEQGVFHNFRRRRPKRFSNRIRNSSLNNLPLRLHEARREPLLGQTKRVPHQGGVQLSFPGAPKVEGPVAGCIEIGGGIAGQGQLLGRPPHS